MDTKTATRILNRPPIQFRQLCAVARQILAADNLIDNFEWSEQIKARIVKLGFTYPDSDPGTIHRAMRAVEVAMEKTGTFLRMFPDEPYQYTPKPEKRAPVPKPGPVNAQAFASVQALIQQFLTSKR